MKAILPDVIFIGFTGMPLLKKDKANSIEVFGGYIHTYKYDEGVADAWGNMQTVFSSRTRLESIARDIIFDMETKGRLMHGNEWQWQCHTCR